MKALCVIASLLAFPAFAAPPATQPDLSGYRTVDTAIQVKVAADAPAAPAALPYLGISLAIDSTGKPIVETLDPSSPAAKAGLREKDQLLSADGRPIARPDDLEDYLNTRSAGDSIKLLVHRDKSKLELSATLAALSRPMRVSPQRAVMGVQVKDAPDGNGALVDRVTPDLPAAKAGVKPGDVLVELNGVAIPARDAFTDTLSTYGPDEEVDLKYRRGESLQQIRVKLVPDPARPRTARPDDRQDPWKKTGIYRMAIIGVEFPDLKHNPKIAPKDWELSMFSKASYTKTSPTSQPVYGSLNDYYQENSCGTLRVEGKMFDYVEVAKKRAEYGFGTGDNQKMLPEAIDKLLARDGAAALDGFDGICFIYAGERPQTTRGGLFWPHKGNLTHKNKRWSFFIVNEGGPKMTNISVFCHEFGHMIALPDLYARPENPGSEGLGNWCLMSQQIANGRPQHMGAWCKQQLGWLKPTVIDPSVKQKLILSPINGSSKECFKVLARPDGSEYFLLENRRKTGFDKDLPGEGLLIWRVVGNRPILEESHGVEGPAGPRSFVREVPFPGQANHSFTPYTIPSSRLQLGGGTVVWITNIQRHEDGRISFWIGYEMH